MGRQAMNNPLAAKPGLCTEAIIQNIDHLIEDLLELVSGTTEYTDFMFHDLGLLDDSCGFAGFEEIMELCKLLGSVLAGIQAEGIPYLEETDHVLLDACYYLLDYERCISRRALLPAIPKALYQKLLMHIDRCDDLPVSDAKVVYRSQGVKAVTISNITKILLPKIGSGPRCLKVVESLRRIYNTTQANTNWLVDLSSLEELPYLIFHALLDYQEKLQQNGRHIGVMGVQDNLLPPQLMKIMQDKFLIQRKEVSRTRLNAVFNTEEQIEPES
jgi:hypothetical protein